jgi:hypothetical protein
VPNSARWSPVSPAARVGERDSFRPPPAGELPRPPRPPALGDGLHWILHGYETAWAEVRGDQEKAVAVRLDTDGARPLYDPPEEPPATMFGAAALLQALGAADVRRIAAFRGLTRGRSAFLAFPRHN